MNEDKAYLETLDMATMQWIEQINEESHLTADQFRKRYPYCSEELNGTCFPNVRTLIHPNQMVRLVVDESPACDDDPLLTVNFPYIPGKEKYAVKQPRIKIVCSDGESNSTQLLLDGKPIPGISKIEIGDIKLNGEISDNITFCQVGLEIDVKEVQVERIDLVKSLLEAAENGKGNES